MEIESSFSSGTRHDPRELPHASKVLGAEDFTLTTITRRVQRPRAFYPNSRFRFERRPPQRRRGPRTFLMSSRIGNHTSRTSFDEVVLPHLHAAHKLARWLTRNEHDAEDAVQEASLRAFRYLPTFSGSNARGWFLRIVRNTCYGSLGRKPQPHTDVFDEERHSAGDLTATPETLALRAADALLIEQTLRDLPHRFRELLVLRELEGLSYQELADVLGIPMGTVMSGLSRARQAFHSALRVRLQHVERSSDRSD